MIILGIDPGFARLGCAVLKKENGGEELIYSTCLTTTPEQARGERLLYIVEQLDKIITKHKPDIMAIEKLFFFKNQKTVLQVAEATGVILYIGTKKGLGVKEFTPLEVKIALTGYGRATKDQVNKMVQSILKIKEMPKLDDEVDAIAVALTCSATLNSPKRA